MPPNPNPKELIVRIGSKEIHFSGSNLSLIEAPVSIRLIIEDGNKVLGKFNSWSSWEWVELPSSLAIFKQSNFSKKVLDNIKRIYLSKIGGK